MTYIRIHEGGPFVPGDFEYEPCSDGWGTATIDGVEYSAIVSHDGDGCFQLADSEVERYEANTAGDPRIEGL